MKNHIFILKYFCYFVSENAELIILATNDLQSLKQWFVRIAIEETIKKQLAPAVIGEVFVRKAVAGICLRACEESPSCHDKPGISTEFSDVIQTLLQSSEYEVRLAVLDFVISHLPSDVKPSSDCHTAPNEDVNDSRADSWMFGELESRFKRQLFTMAIKLEHHTDCLVKVTGHCYSQSILLKAFLLCSVFKIPTWSLVATLPIQNSHVLFVVGLLVFSDNSHSLLL